MDIKTSFTESEFEILKRASIVSKYAENKRVGISTTEYDIEEIKQIIIDGARDRTNLIIQEDRRAHTAASEKKGGVRLCRNCTRQNGSTGDILCVACKKSTSRIHYKKAYRKPFGGEGYRLGSGRAGNRSDG